MSTAKPTFKEELIRLAESVCEQKGWGERYLSERFGQSNAMHILRNGKHGLGLNTAERFQKWLLEQSEPPGCGDGLTPGGSAHRAGG